MLGRCCALSFSHVISVPGYDSLDAAASDGLVPFHQGPFLLDVRKHLGSGLALLLIPTDDFLVALDKPSKFWLNGQQHGLTCPEAIRPLPRHERIPWLPLWVE